MVAEPGKIAAPSRKTIGSYSIRLNPDEIPKEHQYSSGGGKITAEKNQPTKTCIKHLFLLPALIAALGLITANRVPAQTFTTLHSFTNGSDGGKPWAGLILS